MFRPTTQLFFNASRALPPSCPPSLLPDFGFTQDLNSPKPLRLAVPLIKPVDIKPVSNILPVPPQAKSPNTLAKLHPNAQLEEFPLLRAITHGVPDPDSFSYRTAFWNAVRPKKGSRLEKIVFGDPDPKEWV